ncbi:MAG TPA: tripartite tricarboxylate transporter substrate binding protein, partial [Burkholderiales bacterium]|nr:tripartite tricarboxylate transporter substrate binding protein [Burkholderiales bacterium]
DMRAVAALCALAAFAFVPSAHAQSYPAKPIRWIVTFPPGGPTDVIARMVGAKLTEAWGQQVVIDNRAGAGGVIGTELAAKSAADGYTLLFGTSSGLSVNPALSSKLPYDPARDFAPVSLLVINPQILVVNNAVPVNSLKELIALAKSRPGQLNYGSVGRGSPNHLGMELLKSLAGIEMVHVPYKGTSPAVTDLLAGQVQLLFNSMPSVLPLVKSGKLKGLAVGSAQRSPAAPEIPTIAEAGVPGFEYITWYGMFAPARTPVNIVAKLNAQVVKILAEPEMAQRLASQGAEPRSSTPAELATFMRDETERWKKVIRSAGIKAE